MRWTRPAMCLLAILAISMLCNGAAGEGKKKPRATSSPAASRPGAHKGGPTTGAKTQPASPRIASMRLAGEVFESPPDFNFFAADTGATLQDWLQRLAKARNDSNVAAVALEIDGPNMTWAQAQELSAAIARLNAVKPVYAYLCNEPSAADHLVASAGREVAMEASDDLEIIGVGAEMLFFRGTLDKLGIEPQMVQIGAYKGACEPMSCTQPSKEVREVYGWILDDLYDQLVGQIAQLRRLDAQVVKDLIDQGPLSGREAKKAKLVDRVLEKADWEDHVADRVAGKDQPYVWLDDYGKKASELLDSLNPLSILSLLLKGRGEEKILDPTVAIIYADGVIVPDYSGDGEWGDKMVGARTLIDCFDTAADDDRIKAVVFRIDSPGGSAMASEQIYQAVRRCADLKPVIVSVSNMAASGGYYIAMGAPTIYADSSSIVGSIGVICGKMGFSGLMDKLGIGRYEFTRGRNAGLNMLRPWTDGELAVVRKMAQQTYDTFIQRVAASRGKRIAKIDDVAQGRIFTARQAVQNGLVDHIGGLREAIIEAEAQAKIEQANYLVLPRPRTLMDWLKGDGSVRSNFRFSGELADQVIALVGKGRFGRNADLAYLLNLAQMTGRETVLATVPYYLSIRR